MIAITIDRDVCFGSGECVLAAPDVFALGDNGIARVQTDARPIALDEAQRVADNCPSGAISVEPGSSADPRAGEVIG